MLTRRSFHHALLGTAAATGVQLLPRLVRAHEEPGWIESGGVWRYVSADGWVATVTALPGEDNGRCSHTWRVDGLASALVGTEYNNFEQAMAASLLAVSLYKRGMQWQPYKYFGHDRLLATSVGLLPPGVDVYDSLHAYGDWLVTVERYNGAWYTNAEVCGGEIYVGHGGFPASSLSWAKVTAVACVAEQLARLKDDVDDHYRIQAETAAADAVRGYGWHSESDGEMHAEYASSFSPDRYMKIDLDGAGIPMLHGWVAVTRWPNPGPTSPFVWSVSAYNAQLGVGATWGDKREKWRGTRDIADWHVANMAVPFLAATTRAEAFDVPAQARRRWTDRS
jgi:hypothetical protein